MSGSEEWQPIDFSLNKALWKHWGHEVSLPIRVRNWLDFMSVVDEAGLVAAAYGRTLRDLCWSGRLLEDHDDDVQINLSSGAEVSRFLLPGLERFGFRIIRQVEGLTSIERFHRYIDIHPSGLQYGHDVASVSAHGESFVVPLDAEDILLSKYGPSSKKSPGEVEKPKTSAPLRWANQSISLLRNFAQRRGNQPTPRKLRLISREEFLGLQIDEPDAPNWVWRGPHLKKLFIKGETFGQTLQRLEGSTVADLLLGVVETPTDRAFPEPMNLARDFWQKGNNLFLYPFLFGFRHQVMPYSGCNFYISAGIKPELYSWNYYQALPQMTDWEIKLFVESSALEITSGSLTSGRHRACAMLGRLWRGDSYFPMLASVDSS